MRCGADQPTLNEKTEEQSVFQDPVYSVRVTVTRCTGVIVSVLATTGNGVRQTGAQSIVDKPATRASSRRSQSKGRAIVKDRHKAASPLPSSDAPAPLASPPSAAAARTRRHAGRQPVAAASTMSAVDASIGSPPSASAFAAHSTYLRSLIISPKALAPAPVLHPLTAAGAPLSGGGTRRARACARANPWHALRRRYSKRLRAGVVALEAGFTPAVLMRAQALRRRCCCARWAP
jgi:hypothetical protein